MTCGIVNFTTVGHGLSPCIVRSMLLADTFITTPDLNSCSKRHHLTVTTKLYPHLFLLPHSPCHFAGAKPIQLGTSVLEPFSSINLYFFDMFHGITAVSITRKCTHRINQSKLHVFVCLHILKRDQQQNTIMSQTFFSHLICSDCFPSCSTGQICREGVGRWVDGVTGTE